MSSYLWASIAKLVEELFTRPAQAPSLTPSPTTIPVVGQPNVEPEAVKFVTDFEGFSATPYQDSGGTWTIGYGSTRDANGNPVTGNTPHVTQEQAAALVQRDLQSAAKTVADIVTVPIDANQRAALQDFVYNLGARNFESSTLLKLLNQGDFEGAAAQFDLWDHAGSQVLAGLLRRRQAETALFQDDVAQAEKLA